MTVLEIRNKESHNISVCCTDSTKTKCHQKVIIITDYSLGLCRTQKTKRRSAHYTFSYHRPLFVGTSMNPEPFVLHAYLIPLKGSTARGTGHYHFHPKSSRQPINYLAKLSPWAFKRRPRRGCEVDMTKYMTSTMSVAWRFCVDVLFRRWIMTSTNRHHQCHSLHCTYDRIETWHRADALSGMLIFSLWSLLVILLHIRACLFVYVSST